METTLSTGQVLSFPIKFHNLTQAVATFNVRSADVKPLIPRDLRPLSLGYGISEMYIFWLTTEDSDFGPLSEIQVGFMVEEPFYRSSAAFLYANPVSTEFARLASGEIWGVQKDIGDFDIVAGDTATRCSLSIGGQFVLSLESPRLPGPHCEINSMISVDASGPSTVFRYLQVGTSCGEAENSSDVKIVLGDHPLSATIDRLMIDKIVRRYSYRANSHLMLGPSLNRILSSDS